MENSDVYKAPEASLSDEGKYSVVGGWLRFFQVINIVGLVLSILVLLVIAAVYVFSPEVFIGPVEALTGLLEILPGVIFPILVLKNLKNRDSSVPGKIKEYLSAYLGVSFLITILIYFLHKSGYVSEKPTSIIGSVIYYWIWTSYFSKSKRVKAYYKLDETS